MPTYVYVCKNLKCERYGAQQEIKHSFKDTERPHLCETCGKEMGRRPSPFRFGFSPWDVLSEHIDKRYRDYKRRQQTGGRRPPVVD